MTKRKVSSKTIQITFPTPIYEMLKEMSIKLEKPTSQMARELIEYKLFEMGMIQDKVRT